MNYDAAYEQVERDEQIAKTWDTPTRSYPCEIVRRSNEVGCNKPPKPEHYYRKGGIEVIDFIKAKLTSEQYKGYLLGNIYKYSGRCQYKGEYQKDIIKLAQYTNWLLKEEDGAYP